MTLKDTCYLKPFKWACSVVMDACWTFYIELTVEICSTAHMQKLHKFGIVRSSQSSLQTVELVLSLLWSVGHSNDNWEICTLTFHLSQRLRLATAIDIQSVCHLSKFISMLSVLIVFPLVLRYYSSLTVLLCISLIHLFIYIYVAKLMWTTAYVPCTCNNSSTI